MGCDCEICSSTDPLDKRLRTSALLREGPKNFAIDTSPDFREQMLRERVSSLEGVLITHEHYDHTSGIDDLRPLCFSQQIDMPIYCLPRVAQEIRDRFSYAFTGYPGVPRLDIREVNFGDRIAFGSGELELVEVVHGKISIIGFIWHDLAYLTDVKELPARTLVQCAGLKTIVISSLHRKGTHSHLSLDESLSYLKDLRAGRGILIHFSHRMGLMADLIHELPDGVEAGYDGMRVRQIGE